MQVGLTIKEIINIILVCTLVVFQPMIVSAQTLTWQGQLSGWTICNTTKPISCIVGLRYIPGLSLDKSISDQFSINSEISFNTYGSGLIYSVDNIESDGKVRVGMNDFYQKSAGDTTYIDLPFEGDDVEQGETCGKIQSAKWVGKFVSPLSGEILEVNEELEDNCTLINKSPYDEGWIMLLQPSDIKEELKNLYHGDALESWMKKEIEDAEKKKTG